MTMILQLLVAAMAVGLTVAYIPSFKKIVAAIEEAQETLESNLLSMEGNIPLLNDSRRHYAEIVHVIYYHALNNPDPVQLVNYYENYQIFINTSAPAAINNPEIVIQEVKDLFVDVANETAQLNELIDSCVQDEVTCNQLIDDTIKQNPTEFRLDVLIAAGRVADELKRRNTKYEAAARNLEAHQYVISTPKDLECMVERLILLLYRLKILY